MTRQHRFRPEDLTDDQRHLYEAITTGPRSTGPQLFALTEGDGVLRGPFNAFLHSVALGDALQRLGAAVRYRSGLSDRVREMTILVVAAHWDCAFEREAHEAVGAAAGVTEEEMRAIRERRTPSLADPREIASIAVATAMVAGDVGDEVWDQCLPALDQATVFELSTVVGYYAALALQMRVFRV
jgi:4-carboxymuconolactone decarboxylase